MTTGYSREQEESTPRRSEHKGVGEQSWQDAGEQRVPVSTVSITRSADLLAGGKLSGRGNEPVRVSLMQDMQQTRGNRATQRFVQRTKVASDQPVRDEMGAQIHGKAGTNTAPTVQRFGSQEHQSLGNSATNGLKVALGGDTGDEKFDLNYGDVVALAGDYFPPDTLADLAKIPGDKGSRAGTRDEIIYTLYEMNSHDSRFDTGGIWADYPAHFSQAVKDAVTERYQKLATANAAHFAAPRGRNAAGDPNPATAGESSAGSSYRELHEVAITRAYQLGQSKGDISHARAMEAAAQHFLTDAFSAGHLRTEIGSMREYWHDKYPLFWYNLRHKIALDSAIKMNEQDTNATTMFGTVQAMYEGVSDAVEKMAGSLPAVTLGDLLAKVFHDYDNEKGISIQGGGKVFGDDHLDDPDPDNKTRKLAEAAIQAGLVDIEKAYDLGKSGGGLTDAEVCAAVQAGTTTPPGKYVAETMMPKPDASAPQQNWKADTFEELWNKPITGGSGPTVGDRITVALSPGHEIRQSIDDLGDKFPAVDKRGSGDLHPRKAYMEGFVAPLVSDPRAGIIGTIHWAPNYGLRSADRDDVSLATGQELDKQGQLPGMTTPARVSYIKELIDGSVADDEEALVMRIFETAGAAERPTIYKQVEGHDWTGDWKHGVFTSDDDLWNALNKDRLKTLKDLINEGVTK